LQFLQRVHACQSAESAPTSAHTVRFQCRALSLHWTGPCTRHAHDRA